MRAMRVMHEWERDRRPTRDQVRDVISRVVAEQTAHESEAPDVDDIIDALVDANLLQLAASSQPMDGRAEQ